MKFEVEEKKEEKKAGKKAAKGKKGKTPPSSAKKGKDAGAKPGKKGATAEKKPGKDDGKKTPSGASQTDQSMTDNETKQEELGVPVKKEVIIGTLPNNSNLQIADLNDMKQLEGLFRSHTLLAQISGRNSTHYADYCLMAFSFIMRMWQISVAQTGTIVKELAKMSSLKEAEGGGKNSAKGAKGKGKGGKEEESGDVWQSKERPKRKGPLETLPTTPEQWADYDCPDEVLQAFKTEQMKSIGINSSTITKPTLTMHYLDVLIKQLRELGYNQLALPVLAISDIICRDILRHRPLYALIHLKALEVCIELNLENGIGFHEKLAEYKLNPDEQAKCREEIALWKEKQVQVAKEEMRIKASLAEMKEKDSQMVSSKEKELQAKVRMMTLPEDSVLKEDEGDGTLSHLGKKLGAVQFRDVWADTAEVLLDNGLYQPARDLLNESLQAAKAFDEKDLEARVLYLLARLSFYEAQYQQCVNFCMKAQLTYDGDEMFWYKTTILMVEGTVIDHELKHKDRTRKARAILIHALNVFIDIAETRPNKSGVTGFIMAKLEAKLGSIQTDIAFYEYDNIFKPKVLESLMSACKKMQHAASHLMHMGYKQDAVELMREQAEITIKLARETTIISDKHDYYIQALKVLKDAVGICDGIFNEVHTIASLLELKTTCLPSLREAASLKIICSELMLEMFSLYIEEERHKQLENIRKGSVVRALEDYIEEEPTYDDAPLTKEWVESTKVLGECVLVYLSSVHNMVGAISELKTRTLYNIGRCLRLLAVHKHPDPPKQWLIQDMPLLNLKDISTSVEKLGGSVKGSSQNLTGKQDDKKTVTTDQAASDDEDDDPFEAKQRQKYRQQITQAKEDLELSDQYMLQATEILTQAVNYALSKGYNDTAGLAALELVECFGQFDPGLSSQYLALYQSCQASCYMNDLMHTSLVDPTMSQQAALFHQHKNLMKYNVTSNASRGPVMKSLLQSLNEQSTAWKRLKVSSNHLELLKDLSPNFNLLVLQHSPDKRYLYASILDKPNPAAPPPGGKGAGPKGVKALSKAKIVRIETSAKELEELLSRYYWFKHEVMQFLLKMEYQRSLFAQREKMLANLDDNMKKGDDSSLMEDWEEDERRLHVEFLSLLAGMESYLRPITAHLDAVLRPPSAATMSEGKEGKKGSKEKPSTEPDPQNEYLIMLADQHVLELPLEALQALRQDSIVSITRDISLQMFHHKFFTEPLDDAELRERKKREEIKPPTRIPGLRDANKKLAKIIPLDRPVQPGQYPVDTHLLRYMCDPNLECSETEEKKPIECLKTIVDEHEMQFTPRWLGVFGSEHAASVGEYEVYMNESSAFMFYGMERFLAYLPPSKVASLNFEDCQMVLLYDRAQTNISFARQSKQDVLKTQEVLTLERPVETAMLLSLAGINAIFSNQWHCTLAENAEKLDLSMKYLLPRGKTTGQTMRLIQDPIKRLEELRLEKEAELAKLAEKEKPGTRGKDEPKAAEAAAEEEVEEQEEEVKEEEKVPEPQMNRSWYNMVCYGLPNIIMTQMSKP